MFDDFLDLVSKENKDFMSPEICIFGRSVVVVSGHRGFMRVADTEISLRIKGGFVKIEGNGLKLFESSGTDVQIVGEIGGVSYV